MANKHCSSSMIEIGDRVYFIDAGAPMIEPLLEAGHSMNDIKAIFITHTHMDHVNELPHIVSASTWYFKETSYDVYLSEQSIIEPTVSFITATGIPTPPTDRIRFTVYNEDTVYDDGTIRVSFLPTKHITKIGRPAYSILVEAEGKRVLFSGDLSWNLGENDLPVYPLLNEVDAYILEMAHFTTDMIVDYLSALKTKALYFNHISPRNDYDVMKSLSGVYGYPAAPLYDRDVIEL